MRIMNHIYLIVAQSVKRNDLFKLSVILFLACQFYGNAAISISLGFMLLCCVLNLDKLKKLEMSKMYLPFLLFFLFLIANLASSAYNSYNYNEFAVAYKLLPFLYFILIFLVGKKFFLDDSYRLVCKKVFFFSASLNFLILLIVGLAKSITTGNFIFLTYNELAAVFGIQPIYLSALYLLSLYFGIDIIFSSTGKKRIISLVGTLLLTLGVVLLASRTAWLILVLTLPIKVFPLFHKRIFFWGLLLSFGAIILGLIITNPTLKSRLVGIKSNVTAYSGVDLRVKIWNHSINLIKEKPIMGYGMYGSQFALQEEYEQNNFRRANMYRLNSHNQYLQTCLDSGIFSLLLLFLMLLLFCLSSLRNRNAGLFVILIFFSLLTESYFRRFNGILFYCFFYLFFIVKLNYRKHKIDIPL